MTPKEFDIASKGMDAIFAALNFEDAKKFIEMLTGRPYDYTELRRFFVPNDVDLPFDEWNERYYNNVVIPDDLPPIGSGLPPEVLAAHKKAATQAAPPSIRKNSAVTRPLSGKYAPAASSAAVG